jgi:hypothetical protein
MTARRRIILATLWILSLVLVAQWTATAQVDAGPGVEVRFVGGQGQPGGLIGKFDGQWHPLLLRPLPIADQARPSSQQR